VRVVAVVLSLAAQVVQAEQFVIGWIAAALPAAGFLAMVKIALGHAGATRPTPPHHAEPRQVAVPDDEPLSRTTRTIPDTTHPVPEGTRTVRDAARTVPDTARNVRDEYRGPGQRRTVRDE
jgi:hypothetical protein